MLVRAVRAALWADAKTVRWNDLKTHAFSEAESYEMMLEAYEGEKELASKPNQHADLLKMLGLSPDNKSQTKPQPDVPGADKTITVSEAAQINWPGETTKGTEQALPTEETASGTPTEFDQVHRDQSSETANEAIQGLQIEEVHPEEATPKLLKKPSRVTSQPFRRKTKRDKTGGPRRENDE